MSDKTCKLCILTPVSQAFSTLPDGAKPDLCWQHQPHEVRAAQRALRKAKYQAWIDTGVMAQIRERLNSQVKGEM